MAAATDKNYLLRLTNSSDSSCLLVDGVLDGDHQCSEPSHQWTDEEEALHWRSLKEINELLRPYEALHFMMDTWLVLAVQSPTVVYQWRAEAEQRMRARGSPGLTEQQVAAFVDRFMPAYDLYLRELYRIGPQRRRDTASSPVLKVRIAARRCSDILTYLKVSSRATCADAGDRGRGSISIEGRTHRLKGRVAEVTDNIYASMRKLRLS